MSFVHILTLSGGIFEISGFGVVAWRLYRVHSREIDRPLFVARLRGWWRRVILRKPSETVTGRAVSILGGGGIKARGRVGAPPGETLEERVEALEISLQRLIEYVDEGDREFKEELRDLTGRIRALDQAQKEREQIARVTKREAVREDIRWELLGTGLFLIGTGLSVWGGLL